MNGASNTSRRQAADQQHLADRIGRHQPFSQRIVDREQKDARYHQADAGKGGAAAARSCRKPCVQIGSRLRSASFPGAVAERYL